MSMINKPKYIKYTMREVFAPSLKAALTDNQKLQIEDASTKDLEARIEVIKEITNLSNLRSIGREIPVFDYDGYIDLLLIEDRKHIIVSVENMQGIYDYRHHGKNDLYRSWLTKKYPDYKIIVLIFSEKIGVYRKLLEEANEKETNLDTNFRYGHALIEYFSTEDKPEDKWVDFDWTVNPFQDQQFINCIDYDCDVNIDKADRPSFLRHTLAWSGWQVRKGGGSQYPTGCFYLENDKYSLSPKADCIEVRFHDNADDVFETGDLKENNSYIRKNNISYEDFYNHCPECPKTWVDYMKNSCRWNLANGESDQHIQELNDMIPEEQKDKEEY